MMKKVFDSGFFNYVEKNKISEHELIQLILAFSSKRKRTNYLEERRKRHKRLLADLDFRKKLLLSDLEISLMLLDSIRKQTMR